MSIDRPWVIAYNRPGEATAYSRERDVVVQNWMYIVRTGSDYKVMLDIENTLFVFRWAHSQDWEQLYLFDPQGLITI